MLFDLPRRKATPTAWCTQALANLGKLSPGTAGQQVAGRSYHPGQLRHSAWSCWRDCDLIIEAIAERMDWKQDLYAKKIAPFVAEHAVLRLQHLGPVESTRCRKCCRKQLRHRFCGVHFFNPPRYMHLAELIPASATDAGVLDGLEAFLVTTLGKRVVLRQGHPELHRQPHRRVLDPVDPPPHRSASGWASMRSMG
ncbi:MAG: 3-hydroxyacyl-CoA dehydrogenase NAD-binding domain-containing protein [Agrobacterium sp.]|nr:3-hydroxyacyl-CoA dehydrogenase NAD-binding domain-containing protein [Agrobacterium sp.]